jgi:nucleoside-diphosphate-sugar epimerase
MGRSGIRARQSGDAVDNQRRAWVSDVAKTLLTGATGLIGSHLLRCLEPDDVVYAVSRSGRVAAAHHTVPIDLGRPWATDQLPGDIETVVHLAQSEHFNDFPAHAEDLFAVNVRSTATLLEYARGIGARRFVLASTGGIYGGGLKPLSEDSAVRGDGKRAYYIRTRICSELLSECYTEYLNVVCLRFFFVYGRGQRARMLVPRLVDAVRTGRPVTLSSEHGIRLNPIHAEDAAKAVASAMRLDGSHTINVAGPSVLSIRDMADAIGRAVGRSPRFEIVPMGESHDLVADTTRMRSLLCTPRISFGEGIVATLDKAGS